ncbi:UvrD-helicase domain-containing protein [Taylorella equigenitalis]|uniref:DNA 3'-5' helicase II n=1 Tax=Taylorella equigenitalis ATCC 35865 TaxID=743973 RepID=A0ABM5N8F4_9BURK|nr:UvrD-helicase domain-containing protein [Taylorella equigenitalis]AFN35117.1 putative helicase [Taylorella equigenitalis ATCC 35865]ASY38561.1 helicase [Taylorella equigenitalis]WDU51877.1 UvrD-helicase domain-containing protein [Taylorella equigenitalis]VEG32891.1 Putative ATP-dependent DNA helicase yjcD [Taylorella equigenitalis ATCC 35865]
MKAILIEGVAGSGKTTYITKLAKSLVSTKPALLLTFSRTGRDVLKSYLEKEGLKHHHVMTIDGLANSLLTRLGSKQFLLKEEYVLKNILPCLYKLSVDQLYYSGYLSENNIEIHASNLTSLKALMHDMRFYRAAAVDKYDSNPDIIYDLIGGNLTHNAMVVRRVLSNYDGFRTTWLPDDHDLLIQEDGLYGELDDYWDVEHGFRLPTDIVHDLVELLKDNPIEELIDTYPLIAIDEYHDTNPKQFEFLRLLSTRTNNFVAVGDKFQNIFEWRGSNTEVLFESFLTEFKSECTYLNHSYRYGQNLSAKAGNVISRPIVPMVEHETEIEKFNPKKTSKEVTTVISKDYVQSMMAQFYMFTETKKKSNTPLYYSMGVALISLLFFMRYPYNVPKRHFLEKLLPSHFRTLIDLPFCFLDEDTKEEIYKSIATKNKPFVAVLNLLQSHVNCYFYDSDVYDKRFVEGFKRFFDEDLKDKKMYEVMSEFENLTQLFRMASNALLGHQIGWASWVGLKEDAYSRDYTFGSWPDQLDVFKRRYSEGKGMDFLTVTEAKGREFEQAILFGVDSECNKFRGEASNLGRNQFYIAITRVKKNLFYIDCPDEYIFDKNGYQDLHNHMRVGSLDRISEENGSTKNIALSELRTISKNIKDKNIKFDLNPLEHLIK